MTFMLYPIRMPKFVQRLYPEYLWHMPRMDKTIYLTFDDGPTPQITHWVLDTLKQYQAKATFFCLGKNIVAHPDLLHRMIQHKHQVGNHSFSHLIGWKNNKNVYVKDVEKTQRILEKELPNSNLKLFRPPYGKIKKSQVKMLRAKGYRIVFWDVLSGDFDPNLKPDKSLHKTLKHTKTGSIVVFHDSKKAKNTLQYVLPKALKYWKSQGYQFKTL